MPLINSAQLDRFSANPALVHRLIQIFLEMSPQAIEEIESFAASGEIDQVRQKAHSLKGSSAELGAEELSGISHKLQVAAEDGDVSSIGPLIGDLKDCYGKTIAALKEIDPGEA